MPTDAPVHKIVSLASALIRCGAITTGPRIHDEGIRRAFAILRGFADDARLNAIAYDEGGRFPALYCDAGAPGDAPRADFLLVGHYDVVVPQSEAQLEPVVDGDWLRGRGSADMLAVAATALVFLRDLAAELRATGRPAPRLGLLLVGNEEIGETEAWGTPFVFEDLGRRFGWAPRCLIAGERTGEGAVLAGKVEPRNRGIVRVHLETAGQAAHTGMLTTMPPIARVFELQRRLADALARNAARPGRDPAWKTGFQVGYVLGGEENNFNTAAPRAVAGFELRPAWAEDIATARQVLDQGCAELGVRADWLNAEGPVSGDPDHPLVRAVLESAAAATGLSVADLLGRGKEAGSSARYAPEGCPALVWGQAGVGPHAAHEAHYIPSIAPYYRALAQLARQAER